MIDVEYISSYCLAKKGVVETFPFNETTLVFKVMGKMFALLPLENGDRIALKCDPERAMELREEWEEITGAFHMNKKHWNTVMTSGRISVELLRELIDHSYDLVVASLKKSLKEELAAL